MILVLLYQISSYQEKENGDAMWQKIRCEGSKISKMQDKEEVI